MKKRFLTILTAVTAAAMLTACGTVSGTESAVYVSINGVRRMSDEFRGDPDAALDAVLAEQDPEPDEIVSLDNGKFTVTKHLNADDTVKWNGTYSTEQQALKFTYETAEVSGNADPARFTGQIPDMNQSGAYPGSIMPRIYLADIAKIYSRLPIALLRDEKTPFIPEQHGDFLCVPVYGLTVDGTYQAGKDFAMTYVPENTLRDDKYSKAYYNEQDQSFAEQVNEEKLGIELSLLANRYGIDHSENMQFQLNFSGGKWEMFSVDGTKLTGGAYKESKKHSGFLSVYEESDDTRAADALANLNPLFLCIDGGKIYYPGFVRKP